MPMIRRYVEIRGFDTPENARRNENTPTAELEKNRESNGFKVSYRADNLDEAIKKTEKLLIGRQLAVNFVLWEVSGPIYTSRASSVLIFFTE